MDFGGLVCSGSSWELILGFLSGPNASWVSVLPTKPAGKVWATSKKIFWGGCTNTVKSLFENKHQLATNDKGNRIFPFAPFTILHVARWD